MIDDQFVLAAENDLITQIANDTGMNSQNKDVYTSRAMAIVEARRAYLITELTGGSSGIIITSAAGTNPFALGTDEMIACNTINAGANAADVMSFATNTYVTVTYQICVMSRLNGGLFTVALAGASTAVINDRYIALVSKDPKVQFGVEYETGFGVTSKHTLFSLTGNTTAGTTTAAITMGGVAYPCGAANDNVTDATYATNLHAVIVTATLTANMAASYDAYNSYVYVYASQNVSKLHLTFSALSTTTILHAWSGLGSYPQLTGEDVFRLFANAADAGTLTAFTRLDQVNPDDTYCVYSVKFNRDIYAIHGASHTDHYLEEADIYVKSSLIHTNFADSTNPSTLTASSTYNQQPDTNLASSIAFAADTALEMATAANGLFAIWAGVGPTQW